MTSAVPITGRPSGWSPKTASEKRSCTSSCGVSSYIAISSSTTSRSWSTSAKEGAKTMSVMTSSAVSTFSSAPMASNVSAISCASNRREPLNSMCSMKWETPARSLRSSREPTSIQKPSATERTLATRSEMTRSPVSSSLRTTFCTVPLRRRLSRHLRSLPCSVEPTHGPMVGERRRAAALRACYEAENRAVPLRVVLRLVGEAEQRLRVGRVLRATGAAEARTEAGERRISLGGLLEERLDPRDHLPRVLLTRFREEHRELVAADAEGVVRPPQRLDEHVGEGDQSLVPGGMPVAVVELLEVVEVSDDEAE